MRRPIGSTFLKYFVDERLVDDHDRQRAGAIAVGEHATLQRCGVLSVAKKFGVTDSQLRVRDSPCP